MVDIALFDGFQLVRVEELLGHTYIFAIEWLRATEDHAVLVLQLNHFSFDLALLADLELLFGGAFVDLSLRLSRSGLRRHGG